jgi:hypothetical protein
MSFLKNFEQASESNTLAGELAIRGVPVFFVDYGANIKKCLENGIITQRQGIPTV